MDDPVTTWWSAIRRGELLVQVCAQCERVQHPPSTLCRHCGQLGELGWRTPGMPARIAAATQVHTTTYEDFRDLLPYWIAVVELEPGAFLISNLVELPDDAHPSAGDLVEFRVGETVDRARPVFAPAPERFHA